MNLVYQPFSAINLADVFFDSLKEDYSEFEHWFNKKSMQNENAYVFYNDQGTIDGFLYLKAEGEAVDDINPPLPSTPRLKIGTFKINPHGTRLGERFVKKVFDHAVESGLYEIYVTIFQKHEALVSLFIRYGFYLHGKKETHNGVELVLIKRVGRFFADSLENYPVVDMQRGRCFLLAIYPEYHTRMLPDSILNNESFDVVRDVSHTNSIHKVYLTAMRNAAGLQRGDVLLIYRTGDNVAPARFRAVVTSACVVEEVRNVHEFPSYQDFYRYCNPYSVFSQDELFDFYNNKRYPFIIRFSYNVAMKRRITRGALIDNFGLDEAARWGLISLNPMTAKNILLAGGVHESLIVD